MYWVVNLFFRIVKYYALIVSFNYPKARELINTVSTRPCFINSEEKQIGILLVLISLILEDGSEV